MKKTNPYNVCTWQDESNCIGCDIEGELICRQDKAMRKKFILSHLTFRLLCFLGLVYIGFYTGKWWMTIAYAAGFILNFAIIEPRMLCSHCSFYAKSGVFLQCNTLYGLPKMWKYRPGPINKVEKAVQLVSGAFVDLFPVLAFLYGIYLFFAGAAAVYAIVAMIGITVLMILQMVQMNDIIQSEICTRCPNLSCVMNKVPKQIKDAYLKHNPVMMDAWQKAGYKIDE